MNNILTPMAGDGQNHKKEEFWTVIGGRKIYAHSMEALCRTVAYGWITHKEKCICIYCGKEWYDMSAPCTCQKGELGKRAEAMRRLDAIMEAQKTKNQSSIIPPK